MVICRGIRAPDFESTTRTRQGRCVVAQPGRSLSARLTKTLSASVRLAVVFRIIACCLWLACLSCASRNAVSGSQDPQVRFQCNHIEGLSHRATLPRLEKNGAAMGHVRELRMWLEIVGYPRAVVGYRLWIKGRQATCLRISVSEHSVMKHRTTPRCGWPRFIAGLETLGAFELTTDPYELPSRLDGLLFSGESYAHGQRRTFMQCSPNQHEGSRQSKVVALWDFTNGEMR